MSKCPICKSPLYVHKCMACLHSETPKLKKGVKPCDWPCTATINLLESDTGRAVEGVYTLLDGVSDKTDVHGFRVVEKLAPGSHAASVVAATLGDRYDFPVGQDGSVPVAKQIDAGENEFYTFVLDPLRPLKVIVRRRHDSAGVANAKVKLTPGKSGNKVATPELTTANPGEVVFKRLRQDTYKVQVEFDDPGKAKYELEESDISHVLDMSKTQDELIVWVRLVVHLRLKYLCPDTKLRHFPKDFPVTVVFDDNTTRDLKVLDDEGYFRFEIDDDKKKKFTLKFDSTKTRCLVHPAREVPDPTVTSPGARTDLPKTKVFEDPTDEQLQEWTLDGKKLFALPKTWSLVHSEWTQTDVTVAANGQITIGSGVGEVGKPAELTLKPKFQYVRFEFHDRKYGAVGEAHDGKRVAIPAIVLKGARESDDAGAPLNPISGTHDAVSNWVVNPTDAANACQVLPWVKLKDDAGAALPKFNKKLLLEFGWKDGFVQSSGKEATDRKIIVIPPGDDRRKPTKDRPQYYDLPEVWKSKWQYTRLSDSAKDKFFDLFLAADDPELEGSLAEAGKLTFSLDDIVLVDASGNQETIKDKSFVDTHADPNPSNITVTECAMSKDSRITILWLDRDQKKFVVKVHDPYPDAVYWSKGGFAAESDTGPRRNLIAKYPVNPRVVVFCSEFHDVFDKRTKPADCTGKKIMGARAAKIEDTDISSKKVLVNQAAHVTKAYVGYQGSLGPRWHYLHYAEVGDHTVYGALVVYWSATFVPSTNVFEDPSGKKVAALPTSGSTVGYVDHNGTAADVDDYRDKGLALAMKRWNDKDYYFEENNDKTDLRIKTFALFEAKGVKQSDGSITPLGGKRVCRVWICDDKFGSWAYNNGSGMMMRRSGAKDEGEGWGDGVSTLPAIPQFDRGNAHPKCAFAHELGHSAFQLFDSYVTMPGRLYQAGHSYPNQKLLSSSLWGYDTTIYTDKKEGQEYVGMPYELDIGAMMKANRAETRLRYAWLRANWLNDQAQAGGVDKLPELLGGRRFRAAYEAPGKPKLKYHREETDRNIYAPRTSAACVLENARQARLHLYSLGDDEFARVLKGGPYTGILVVALKICAKFESVMAWAKKGKYFVGDVVKNGASFYTCKTDHSNKDFDAVNDWQAEPAYVGTTAYAAGNKVVHAGKWYRHGGGTGTGAPGASGSPWKEYPTAMTLSQQVTAMQFLNTKIKEMMEVDGVGKFKLYGGGDFATTQIRFFPQWAHDNDPGGTHLTLIYSPGTKAFQPDGATVRAGTNCEAATLIRYLFGKLGDDPTQWATQGMAGDLKREDLGKLSEWMNTNSGGKGFIVADNG